MLRFCSCEARYPLLLVLSWAKWIYEVQGNTSLLRETNRTIDDFSTDCSEGKLLHFGVYRWCLVW